MITLLFFTCYAANVLLNRWLNLTTFKMDRTEEILPFWWFCGFATTTFFVCSVVEAYVYKKRKL